jgi:hypothetical protein
MSNEGDLYRRLRRALETDASRTALAARLAKAPPMTRAVELVSEACLRGVEEAAGDEGVDGAILRHAVADELGGRPFGAIGRRPGEAMTAFDEWEEIKRAAADRESAALYATATLEAAKRAAKACSAIVASAALAEGLDARGVRLAIAEALRRR